MSSELTLSYVPTRRSRIDVGATSQPLLGATEFTLGNLTDYLRKTDVPGPIHTKDCDQGSRLVGHGAQFDVFSRRVIISGPFITFDRPFSDSSSIFERSTTSKLMDPVLYENLQGEVVEYHSTIEVVAIKRAKLAASLASQPLSSTVHTLNAGAGRTQLRDTILEVIALANRTLRHHPNIVTLLAWGYDSHGDNQHLFSPTLFVEHATASLSSLSATGGLPWGVKKHLCCGAAFGLAALHECGIIHGDVKLENVLVFSSPGLEYQCIAKLSDFGISITSLMDGDTPPTLPRGTHGWAAPEQNTGRIVTPELAHICDIWSYGMTVWSVMTRFGHVPTYEGDVLEALQGDFVNTFAPPELAEALIKPLSQMLQSELSLRSKNLSEIKSCLRSKTWEDTEAEKQRFISMIHQPIETGLAELENLSLTGMPWLKSDQALDTPQAELDRSRRSRKSWAYDARRATEFASRDGVLLNQLSLEPISTSELFTIAMAHALEWRYKDEVLTLHLCATKGYLPAQAIYAQISSARARAGAIEVEEIPAPIDDWAFNAVESGYLFSGLETASPETHLGKIAWQTFRRSGGYSNHYCSMSESPNGQLGTDAPSLGLSGNLEEDLQEFKLHLAAALDELLTSGPSCLLDIEDSLNSRDHWGDTAIMKACMAGHINSLRALVDANADSSLVNESSGVSALHWLFVFPEEHVDEACSLLQKGGVDFKSPSLATAFESFHFPFAWPSGEPLHWAVFAGRQRAIKALITHGADMNRPDVARQTPLHIAMKMTNVEIVQLLLDLGANLRSHPDLDDEDSTWSGIIQDPLRTPVHDFIWSPLEVGVDSEFEDFDDGVIYIPLQYEDFIFKDDKPSERIRDTLNVILSHEPESLTWKDSRGWTCLNYLLGYGRVDAETLQLVIDHSPPVDDVDDGTVSILYFAFFPTFPHKAHRAPNYDHDLELSMRFRQLFGSLPSERRTAFVNRPEPLVPDGVDMWSDADLNDLKCRSRRTPLHYAAVHGLPLCTTLLLEYGADPIAKTCEGKTPLDEVSDLLEKNDRNLRGTRRLWPPNTIIAENNVEAFRKTQQDMFEARGRGRRAVAQILSGHMKKLGHY